MIEDIVRKFSGSRYEFELFMDGTANLFAKHPSLNNPDFPIVHSIRSRIKDESHLASKIERKIAEGSDITLENCFHSITDYSAIRVLHLRQDDVKIIKEVIDRKISSGDWHLNEEPVAYTWDPEYKSFFEELGCKCKIKESSYTSVHFVIRPRSDSLLSCEIQVRTLFEEIWGEVDHNLNYPIPTDNASCREQLRVLAKVIGAGSRLVTSIYNTK